MPYLYTAVREMHDTGLPIMRALWLHYPDDPTAVARGDEYLWGRDMLVAPVVEKGATTPHGVSAARRVDRLLDRTSASKAAARSIAPVDLATMPLYVRAGAVHADGPGQAVHRASRSTRRLTLVVYPGRRRHVVAVRGRRQVVRLSEGRVDAHRDDGGRTRRGG